MKPGPSIRGAVYAAAIVWVNAYVCRNWLFHPTAAINTLHGHWAAIARLAEGWWQASWWPYWEGGMPLEFAGAPLVPALTAAVAASTGMSHLMALQAVAALFYCAAPCALFLMAWRLTHAPEWSFFAALFFSLLSPAAPNPFQPQRLFLQSFGDATPDCAALTFLLLFVLFLTRSIERRRPVHYACAALSLTFALLAAPLALLPAALAAACAVAVAEPGHRADPLRVAATIGLLALALAARYLPPSLWFSLATAPAGHDPWLLRFLLLLSAMAVVGVTLLHYWPRAAYLALLAFTIAFAPLLARWFDRQPSPPATGFQFASEAAIAVLAVFGVRRWLRDRSPLLAGALAVAALALAVPQVLHHRRLAKDAHFPADVRKTLEYRLAVRAAAEPTGTRVWLPDSTARWANAFTAVHQVSGGAPHSRPSLAWLKARGAGLAVTSSTDFDGVLPVLWREDGATAYRVPQGSPSLAHLVPPGALLDAATAPLDDPHLPAAASQWLSSNRLLVTGVAATRQVLSVQVNHHPGWRATLNGRPVDLHPDGLGFLWLRTAAPGAFTLDLHYVGGWELRLCQWASAIAVLACIVQGVRK